jgi:glycerophosphoryl diester phosphodiesterase
MPETTMPETTMPETTVSQTTVPETTPPTTVPAPVRPTIDELLASGDVLNLAHAGGDQEWPHSTFYAYDQAIAAGADVLEMDVQLTGDGVLIVQHDDTVDKTTNGTGRVDSYTFDEIAALDAGYWFAEGCWPCHDLPDDQYLYRGVRTGEVPAPEGATADDFRIVRFAEVVERYPDVAFDIEIKGTAEAGEATADALAAEIDEFGLTEHVAVVSFDDQTVEYFHSVAPDVAVSPGVGAMSAWLLDGVALDPAFRIVQVPPLFGDTPVITPEFWDAVDAAGVAVWMWPNDASTQENAEFYQEMIDQGVTGIIAGRPTEVPG